MWSIRFPISEKHSSVDIMRALSCEWENSTIRQWKPTSTPNWRAFNIFSTWELFTVAHHNQKIFNFFFEEIIKCYDLYQDQKKAPKKRGSIAGSGKCLSGYHVQFKKKSFTTYSNLWLIKTDSIFIFILGILNFLTCNMPISTLCPLHIYNSFNNKWTERKNWYL